MVTGNEGGRAGHPGGSLRGTAAGILLFGCDELHMLAPFEKFEGLERWLNG